MPLQVGDLDAAVRSFGGCPVYGWEFFDPPGDSWSAWRPRLSNDASLADGGPGHVIENFPGADAEPRHFDLLVWFGQIQIIKPDGLGIPAADFIAAGVRWWDGLYSGDSRTSGKGIFPLRKE